MHAIKEVEVRGKTLGGKRPLICTPIVAKTAAELQAAADEMLALGPDVIEWRVDYFDEVEDIPAVLAHLAVLRKTLDTFPFIFTCRVDREGGARAMPEGRRLELLARVVETGKVDLVDIEMSSGDGPVRDLIKIAKAHGTFVIVSNHDFTTTPPVETLVERLRKEQDLGADVAKLAVMPTCTEDVLKLLLATTIMREQHARIPLITMSMSAKGLISRVGGATFGSALTFGAGRSVSAPGQIPVAELRTILDILEKNG
jgi:3-dehydroquinate dehydratase-1